LTAGNARVKEARKLNRRSVRAERRLFLAEGPNAVTEALAVPDCVVEVFATPVATERYADLADAAPVWTLVEDRAVAGLSDSVTPAGVVAVCRFLDLPQPTDARLVALCAEIRDPGNAGTVIRCADAAGADAVLLAGSSVDPYNGKCVRASAGSLFHLPLTTAPRVEDAVAAARAAGLTIVAADGSGSTDLHEAESQGLLSGPTAWMFGNEAWGLPPEVAALADVVVRVPIFGRAESLNLATAAAVCLYASARIQAAR
jgi:RNA methyltransferase, TrmH family